MSKPEITLQDCDFIIKKHLKTDAVIVIDFILTQTPNQNFQLKINTYYDQKKIHFVFFVKSPVSLSETKNILDNFEKSLPNFPTDITPKVYHVKPNVLVFEDLQSQGFKSHDALLSLDQLDFGLKKLAQLHAASFAFEEKQLRNSKKFRLDKEYALLHLNFSLKKPEVSNVLESILDDTEELRKMIGTLEEKQFSSKFRKTLCHGNLIATNFMYNTDNGGPSDCRLINLKSNFYAPPAYDVLQLIFFNSSQELQQHLFHTLLEHYYEFLSTELKRYEIDSNNIISYENFLLSVHFSLPLIKLDVVLRQQNKDTLQELKTILLCPLITKEDCYAIIKRKIGTTNYTFEAFQVTPLREVSGFLGEYHRLQIKLRHHSKDETFNFFIKCSPKTGIPREIAADLDSFPREVFMYETLVPQMKKYGINIIDECLPKNYFYRPGEFIVSDDMSLLNYENLNALEPLDFTALSVLIKKLATFHSCSLILEEKVSEELGKPYRLIEAYRQYFDEPLFFEDEKHLGARSFITGIKSVLAAVNLFPEISSEKTRANFRKFWPKLKELFYTVTKTSNRFRNVLNHGDLWTSNMLAKLENRTPVDCVLIDFQIVRYCPPAYDILSALHLTTDRTTRLKYEDQLLKIYYEEMSTVLNSYGYSVEKLYPYDDYIGCIKYMKPQMVLQAAVDCVLTMCTPEEISLFLANEEQSRYVYFEDRTEFLAAMCKKSELYKRRIQECILDIYDYCDSVCTE